MYNLDQIWHKIYLKKKPQKLIWSDLASNQIEIELKGHFNNPVLYLRLRVKVNIGFFKLKVFKYAQEQNAF